MAKAEQSTPTEYTIIQKAGDTWKKVSQISARSRNEAIKLGTNKGGEQLTGDFKAVPQRSWELTVTITTETKPVINFSESKNGTGATEAPSPVIAA